MRGKWANATRGFRGWLDSYGLFCAMGGIQIFGIRSNDISMEYVRFYSHILLHTAYIGTARHKLWIKNRFLGNGATSKSAIILTLGPFRRGALSTEILFDIIWKIWIHTILQNKTSKKDPYWEQSWMGVITGIVHPSTKFISCSCIHCFLDRKVKRIVQATRSLFSKLSQYCRSVFWVGSVMKTMDPKPVMHNQLVSEHSSRCMTNKE